MECHHIETAIREHLGEAEVLVKNPMGDGQHFEAVVIAAVFHEKSMVEQHQMVMEPLKMLFKSTLHALSLKTYTPDAWERKNV